MACRLSELCDKEIVNMKDGAILGCIGDLDIETCDAKILAMVIPGPPQMLRPAGAGGGCGDPMGEDRGHRPGHHPGVRGPQL